MSSFAPTGEKLHAREIYLTGRSFVIEAGAGTGKTSALVFFAEATPAKRIQYVAFNKSIVADSRGKFPSNVNCSTAHSLAWRSVAAPFLDREKSGRRMRSVDIANRLGIEALRVQTFEGESKLLSSTFLAGLVIRAALRFAQTADAEPTARNVPVVPGLDGVDRKGGPKTRGDANEYVANALVPAVRRAWADLTNPNGGLPFTKSIAQSVYLKLWQLSRPVIGADVVLFDEAQDASPVMVDVVALQADAAFRAAHGLRPAQIVWVGDSQQQIYSFTGAINALANVPRDDVAFLTKSFRFGDAIAEVANHVLSFIPTAELRLTGNEEKHSIVGPIMEPGTILCRTNATAVRSVLQGQADGKRVHLIGGGYEVVSFAKAALDLQNGLKTDHPELACFDSWSEVQTYVEEDEQGGDLRLLVSLVDEFGVATILEALDQQSREDEADLIVSTAHKAKGREWDSVQIAPDFPEDRLAEPSGVEELRLLYVAVTRAKLELDVENVLFLRDRVAPNPANAPAPAPIQPREERVEKKRSEHVGTVGGTITVEAGCVKAHGMTTRHGYTYLTTFVTADGDVLKAFLDDELRSGAVYRITANVKSHDEYRGENETRVNYVHAEEIEPEIPAPLPAPAATHVPDPTPAPAAPVSTTFVDDGKPF